jgi:hypothetical protein
VFLGQLPQLIADAQERPKFERFQPIPGSQPFAVSAVAGRNEAS